MLASFGGDPTRIHVAGHFIGRASHGLRARYRYWTRYDLPPNVLAGAALCSGMYELAPVALSARRSYVTFDDATLAELSSQRHLERIAIPVIVAYGTEESPEFQRQGRDYAAALAAAGKNVHVIVAEG